MTIHSLALGSLSKSEFKIFTVLFLCSTGFSAISILNSEASASGIAAAVVVEGVVGAMYTF